MLLTLQQTLPRRQFQQWDAFLNATTGDAEKVAAIGFGEAAIAFGDVGSDGKGGAVQLIDEKVVAAWEIASESAD